MSAISKTEYVETYANGDHNSEMSVEATDAGLEIDENVTIPWDWIVEARAKVDKRPPLGCMPHFIWLKYRADELRRAIGEYMTHRASTRNMIRPFRDDTSQQVEQWWVELREIEVRLEALDTVRESRIL